jgi:hypothetical protein
MGAHHFNFSGRDGNYCELYFIAAKSDSGRSPPKLVASIKLAKAV